MEERKEPSADEGKKASPGRPVWLSSRSILPRLPSLDIMDIGFCPGGAGNTFVGVVMFTFPLPVMGFW